MLFLKLFRLLSGYVKFSVWGDFPERFFNLCAVEGRSVWDMKAKKDDFSAYVLVKDYLRLRSAARRARVRLRVKERHGLPFLLHRYRFRVGTAAGFLAFCFLLWFLSLFVWNVQIVGIREMDPKRIQALLAQYGVTQGARIQTLDVTNLPQSVMLAEPDIAWMSININGCVVTVEISERIYPPQSIDRKQPCNIKASCDGRILEMQVMLGEAVTQKGDAVAKGDLLVSGVQEYSNGLTAMHHASAVVWAETQRQVWVEVPFCQSVEQSAGRTVHRWVLQLFHAKIPLFLGSVKGEYDRAVHRYPLTLDGVEMPLSLTQATFHLKQTKKVVFTEEQALEQARARLLLCLSEELPDTEILSFQERMEVTQEGVRLGAELVCKENIAMEEDILIFE